jgi:probable H4MPT-linked C1 transfer pathway protein
MICGWDIGGVNTKVACVTGGSLVAAYARPFELQRAPDTLVTVLRELAAEIGADGQARHAVTMTAELSQMFRTKREGVAFVLDALERAFPGGSIRVFTVDGRFLDCGIARTCPLDVAAANWAATATLAARFHPNTVLVDVGTTTTDIIPIVEGRVAAIGRMDPDRLASGELVYAGAVRTPVEALVRAVPYRDGVAQVSAEAFALTGDVHAWRGDLAAADYTWPTPDGRPATHEFCGERLARVICADREMLTAEDVSAIAGAVADAQARSVGEAIRRVAARQPTLRTALVTGIGAFIAARAASDAGMDVTYLSADLGQDGGRCAPAAAVALLLENASGNADPEGSAPPDVVGRSLRSALPAVVGRTLQGPPDEPAIVVKIGGGLLAFPDVLASTLDIVKEAAAEAPLVIVPGGGPFADSVRAVDSRLALSDDAAHWMAILAMDQYANLLASRLPGTVLVEDRATLMAALAEGKSVVVAPSRWLRTADPLPHSWDVTSDSIAAWICCALGTTELVLIKPPGAAGPGLVDRHFSRVADATLNVRIVPAGDANALQRALRGRRARRASASTQPLDSCGAPGR